MPYGFNDDKSKYSLTGLRHKLIASDGEDIAYREITTPTTNISAGGDALLTVDVSKSGYIPISVTFSGGSDGMMRCVSIDTINMFGHGTISVRLENRSNAAMRDVFGYFDVVYISESMLTKSTLSN